MKKIIGIGNSLVDYIIKLNDDSYLDKIKLPKGSMNLVDASFSSSILKDLKDNISQRAAGGSTANTITGLAKLGAQTAFIGKVGKDEVGDFFKNDLKGNGVTEKMFSSSTESGRVAALITPDSERTFATYLGASIELAAADLKTDLFKDYDICFIEGYLVQNHELIETACKLAAQNKCEICIDLASYNVVNENRDFLKRIIKEYINIVFANEDEAKSITGAEPEKALDILSADTDIAVVKIGKNGSMAKKDGKVYKAGVIKANAIDTTGAGDLYASGFIYGYAQNLSIDTCCKFGAVTSGNVVEVLGAKMNEQRWKNIIDEIKRIG